MIILAKFTMKLPNILEGIFEIWEHLRQFWSVKNVVRTRNGFLMTEFFPKKDPQNLLSANRALR